MGKGPNRDILEAYKLHARRVSDYGKRMRRTIYHMKSKEEADAWYKRYITGAYIGNWYKYFYPRDAEKAIYLIVSKRPQKAQEDDAVR